MDELIKLLSGQPSGLSAGDIERALKTSRSSVNRLLRDAIEAGLILPEGEGRARVYHVADPLVALRQYINKPLAERQFAMYREELLNAEPSLTSMQAGSLTGPALDKRDMVRFLVDFSCASSALEGGTYSLLDTLTLIEYGEQAPDKPLADAYLVLNHKNAFEYLYDNPSLDSIFEVHKRLVDDHGRPELENAPHFLGKNLCGVVREYEEVNITASAYAPPYRPGTGYIRRMLDRILETASSIEDPIQSSFYLLTRLPYLQPFVDGNKRTSRAMCNVPLLKAGLPPVSFMDFGKREYLESMLAFYELGDIRLAERCFTDAYVKSITRLRAGPHAARK